jgi:uncharacterized protein
LRRILTPKEIHASVADINLHALYNKGIRTLFLDVDNTLMRYDERVLSPHYYHWVVKAKSAGFSIFLLSNNLSYRRILRVCEQTETQGVHFACKPFTPAIKDLARRHGVSFKTSAVIGDQVLKDVIVGNWVRAYSILVDPIDKQSSFFKMLQREFELWILNRLS